MSRANSRVEPTAEKFVFEEELSAPEKTALLTLLGAQPLDAQLTSISSLGFAGNQLKVVRVNAGENAFELASVSVGSGDALTSGTLDQFTDVSQTSGATLTIPASATVSGTNTGDQDLSGYALTSSLGTAAAADVGDFAEAVHTHVLADITDAKITQDDFDGTYVAGAINTSGTGAGPGGYIVTSGGGFIDTSNGGNIDTSGGGGPINTSGGGGAINTYGNGGSIDTSNGGGNIDTTGTGTIGLGTTGTRTTVSGTATADRDIDYPDASGIVALTSDLAAITPASIGAQPLDAQLTSLAGLSYTSNTLKVVRVNSGETGFELATISAGGGDAVTSGTLDQFTDVTQTSGATLTIPASATISGSNTGDNAANSLYSGLVSNATHTGEVTGSTELTITNGAVTLAKLANLTSQKLIGRHAGGSGTPQEVGIDGGLEFSGANIRRAALTGDVTASAGDNATTLANTAVSAGSYVAATITVDSKGRITAASASGAATLTGTETLANKTLTNPTVNNYTEGVVAIGNSGTAQTIVLTNGTFQTVTLTGNCTFTMPTATAGKSFILRVATGAGGFTAAFTGVKFSGGTAPTITAAASKYDLLSFVADGTAWSGSIIQNFTA
jgi:hypothetical protein